MTQTGGLSSGLASLATWVTATNELSLEHALQQWVDSSDWHAAGFCWPIDPPSRVTLTFQKDRPIERTPVPNELPEVAKNLVNGKETTVWQLSTDESRIYAAIRPAGTVPGVIWAERKSPLTWTETERNFLMLSARILEKSPALNESIGPVIEPSRLEQRLKDASVIAGRMAHDFGNLLTGIMGFADLTLPLVPANSPASKYLSEINVVVNRGILFTQQLHQLSRSAQVHPKPGQIEVAIEKERKRVLGHLPTGIQIHVDLSSNLGLVAMETPVIESVLAHLLGNAIEACPKGGKIQVGARKIDLDCTAARNFLGQVNPGTHVEVTIQDNGSGIKPEVKRRLFVEPFYTTKIRHRGLGLATVYRTLFAHQGGIRIDAVDSPDTGTIARVVLPLATARPVIAPTAQLHTPALKGSTS